MDEFYIGAMVDTPDGIGEIVDIEGDEDSPLYIVRLESHGDENEYQDFELTPLDEDVVETLYEDEFDLEDDEFEGDRSEFDAEFGEDDE